MDPDRYEEFRRTIVAAIWRDLEPLEDEIEAQEHIDNERLFPLLREMGAFALTMPESHGGLGLTMGQYVPILAEFAKVHGGIRALVHVHNSMGHAVADLATPAQRDELLPGFADGSKSAAFALTEPDHGTGADVGTTATIDGDDYVINGRKWLITNSDFASHFMVICKIEGRPSIILVERADRKSVV